MLKLLQIAVTAGGGSIGSIATQIGDTFADEFNGKSFITYHFRCYKSQSPKNNSIRVGNPFTFFCHILATRLFDAHGLASWYDTKKLIRFMEHEQIDIVHLHNIHGYYVNVKMLIDHLVKNNIPVVWTIHDCWNFTGHCAHFNEVSCDKWKIDECRKCPYKTRYPGSIFLNRSAEMYQMKKRLFNSLQKVVFVPVSDWEKQMLTESFLRKKPIKRIYNGIDLDIFKNTGDSEAIKEELGIAGKFVIIGVATGWGPDKGIMDYLKLATIIPESMKIVLVGVDENIQKQLPGSILCLPRTFNQQQLAEYYSLADVLTSLSVQESMGLTVVEAMACGTPAIVYDNTAQSELVDKSTGFTIETGSVEQVLAVLFEVQTNGKSRYSDNCRKRAERMFDKNKCYGEYIELYKQLIDGTERIRN